MTSEVAEELEFVWPPLSAEAALARLAAPVRSWFVEQFREPTLIQRLAWPALLARKHVLIAGPTGSGKSLAAFVPIFQRLLSDPFAQPIRCLYIAPLKALTNDAPRTFKGSSQTSNATWPPAPPCLGWQFAPAMPGRPSGNV